MSRRAAATALLAIGLALFLPGSGTGRTGVSPVDALLAGCPPAADVAAIDADLSLSFEADPTGGTLVCTTAAGSADLTLLQRRVYQTLRAMRAIELARPFPWTSQALYPWLVSAIDGIRFRGDITTSFCCSPDRVININVGANSYLMLTDLWIDPPFGGGLYDTAGVITHEARHSQGPVHTCGTNDQTLPELGAWGVQYYLGVWTALFSGTFFDRIAREAEIAKAEATLGRICTLPTADVSISVTDTPDPVSTGATLTYTAQVANAGPDAAPEVFVDAEIPPGTRFVSATASQGSCTATAGAVEGPIGCTLGAIASGGSATTAIQLVVTVPPGSSIIPGGRWTAHVLASARDPVSANGSSSAATIVALPPPPPRCPGTPRRGGIRLVGTAGNDTLRGTGGNDVICGAGGNDRITGLAGSDTLRGDAGSDTIFSRDRSRDFVSCGSGFDIVYADRRDAVASDCERIRRA